MIACVAIDDFGLAVEVMDSPSLAGRPIVLLQSASQPLVVEASAAARQGGVVRGMDWISAQAACPGLSHVYARPERYATIASLMVQALAAVSPDLEPGVPGTCFLDLTACQAYYRNDPARIARLLLDQLRAAGVPEGTVGISGDRTTARVAARQTPRGGLQVVPPGDASGFLSGLTLYELCGAGRVVTDFLAEQGVNRCGDIARLPHGLLAERFGNHGRRLWLMAQGQDPTPVRARVTVGAGTSNDIRVLRTLPPACEDEATLHASLLLLAQRLQQRLRREGREVQTLRIRLRCPEGWRQAEIAAPALNAPNGGTALRRVLRRHWFGEEVSQVQLIAVAPPTLRPQPDFFVAGSRHRSVRRGAGRSRTGQSQIP